MHQSSIINSPMLIAANGNFLVSQTHDVSDQQLWIALTHFLSIAQRHTWTTIRPLSNFSHIMFNEIWITETEKKLQILVVDLHFTAIFIPSENIFSWFIINVSKTQQDNKVTVRWSLRREQTPGWDCCQRPEKGLSGITYCNITEDLVCRDSSVHTFW